MKKQLSITIATTVLALTLPGLANAQFTVVSQIGGVPYNIPVTTETFNGSLPSILSLSGNAFLATGTPAFGYTAPYYSGNTAAYFGESPNLGPDATQYVAVQSGGSATLTFSTPERYLGLLWGSVDYSFNSITFYDSSSNQIGQVLASQVSGVAVNDPGINGTAYVNITSSTPFSSAVFQTTGPQGNFTFEFDDIAYSTVVPEPATGAIIAAGLGVFGFVLRRKKA
jgi:hypothetical protein